MYSEPTLLAAQPAGGVHRHVLRQVFADRAGPVRGEHAEAVGLCQVAQPLRVQGHQDRTHRDQGAAGMSTGIAIKVRFYVVSD